jgi:hypothetical protein
VWQQTLQPGGKERWGCTFIVQCSVNHPFIHLVLLVASRIGYVAGGYALLGAFWCWLTYEMQPPAYYILLPDTRCQLLRKQHWHMSEKSYLTPHQKQWKCRFQKYIPPDPPTKNKHPGLDNAHSKLTYRHIVSTSIRWRFTPNKVVNVTEMSGRSTAVKVCKWVSMGSLSLLGAGVAQWYRAELRAGWSGLRVPAGDGDFSLHHRVQICSGAHPASYPVATRGPFPGGKASGAWSWPLTYI